MSESQYYVSVIWEDETSVDGWWGGLFPRSTHDIIFSAEDINASKKKKHTHTQRKATEATSAAARHSAQ